MTGNCNKYFKIGSGKRAAFGQSIMQVGRPTSTMAILQIVFLPQHFSPGLLVDSLNALRFWSPYTEVLRLEMNAAIVSTLETFTTMADQCIPFVADNTDRNIRTLDGKEIFHGMGIIAALTPTRRR